MSSHIGTSPQEEGFNLSSRSADKEMQDDIKLKLSSELTKNIDSEAQVIYILSRIRKIIDSEKRGGEFKVLKFYCNWALHHQIDDTAPVDKYIRNLKSPDTLKFLDFSLFSDELLRFFKKHSLPSVICTDKTREENFKSLLIEILLDTPLMIKKIMMEELRLVRIPETGLITFRWTQLDSEL